MSPNLPRRTLHLISQAHLDPVWLWPQRDGVAETLTTVQSAADRCAETPAFKFTRSSAAAYRWVKEMDPRLLAEVGELVRAGRWEVVGGWVEQPDCNLPGAESFLRQALYGKRFFRDEFGAAGDTTIGYNPDSFGHCGGLPRLLRHSGYDAYAFMRPEPWSDPDLPLLFWWESDDGSRVLGCRIPSQYSQSYAATADDIEKTVREAFEQNFVPGFDHGVMWFGVGNHGGGPTREHIARVLELQQDHTLPEIRFSTLRDFLTAVRASPAAAKLPVVRGELGYVFRGCYAANGETKLQHRACEKALFAAEALQMMEDPQSAPSGELREAWWQFLFSEFHDILAGTCVSSAQGEIRDRFGAVLTTARDHALRSAARIARRVDTRGEPGSVLFAANPLPWARAAVVQLDTFVKIHGREEITGLEAPDGTHIPIQWLHADANFGPWGLDWGKLHAVVPLPPSGHRVFRVLTRPAETLHADPFAVADPNNPQFTRRSEKTSQRVMLDRPALASLTDAAGAEFLTGPAGVVVVRDTGGTWGHGLRAYDELLGRPEWISTEVLEDGPLITITRQKSRWDRSEIWMDVIRRHDSPLIGLRFRINWQQHREQLKLEIPTALTDTRCVAKMPAEVAVRPADGGDYPCHDWVALEGLLGGRPATVALINDSSYSHDATGGVLRMTLVRGVPHAEHPPFFYENTSNLALLDHGWQERGFQLLATTAGRQEADLERLSQEFQIPAIALFDSAHAGDLPREMSGISIEPSHIAVLAIKPAEDETGSIIRIQECAGQAAEARIMFGKAVITMPLQPWQIASLRVHADGRHLITDALENARAHGVDTAQPAAGSNR